MWIVGWADEFADFFCDISESFVITNDKLERLLLMLAAYFSLWPSTWVYFCF